MAKKRTKKQKQKAKHIFLKKPTKSLEKRFPKADVKGQKKTANLASKEKTKSSVLPSNSEKKTVSASIRHDLIKSLIVSGLIITAEVMLYLAWK